MTAVGEPAPDFRLLDLNGIERRPEQARGRILVVNFWSAECPWSARADRKMLECLETWGESVQYWCIASNANESEEEVRRVADERGLPVVLRDEDQQAARRYQARTTPHLFVLDEAGMLRYRGAFDDRTFRKRQAERPYLFDAVTALLSGESPLPEDTKPYGCTVVYHSP